VGQFIWVLMWNDMPNQKVVFESFHIAPNYVSSTSFRFSTDICIWNLTIFLHNKQSVGKQMRTMWLHADVNNNYKCILHVAKHLHRKDISTKKKILVPRLKLIYFGLCAGVSRFSVTCQLWVILNNSEQVGAIS